MTKRPTSSRRRPGGRRLLLGWIGCLSTFGLLGACVGVGAVDIWFAAWRALPDGHRTPTLNFALPMAREVDIIDITTPFAIPRGGNATPLALATSADLRAGAGWLLEPTRSLVVIAPFPDERGSIAKVINLAKGCGGTWSLTMQIRKAGHEATVQLDGFRDPLVHVGQYVSGTQAVGHVDTAHPITDSCRRGLAVAVGSTDATPKRMTAAKPGGELRSGDDLAFFVWLHPLHQAPPTKAPLSA